MGLLEQQNDSLLPVTANPKLLAQALKARQQPRTQLTGQGLLDTAAIGLSPVPVIGDALGLAADASRFYNEPESRTPLNFGLAALGLIPFVPPLVSAGLGKFAQSQGKTLGQLPTGPARNQAGAIVYHGSPHKFDAFDSSKIGTGEGAQAYGHGLYFAESPDVAKSYVTSNGNPTNLYQTQRLFNGPNKKAAYDGIQALIRNGAEFSIQDGMATARMKPDGKFVPIDWLMPIIKHPDIDVAEAARAAHSAIVEGGGAEKASHILGGGSLYKVDIPDDKIAQMLNWDLPFNKQAENVQKSIANTGINIIPDELGRDLYSRMQAQGTAMDERIGSIPMREILSSGQEYASKKLNSMGIPGIRYLDGNSRTGGLGTSNFVIFDDSIPKIIGRD